MSEPQPCPWCAMKLTAQPVTEHVDYASMAAQWGVMLTGAPEDLWSSYVCCPQCWARGPIGTAITREAAIGVAVGRWSEMVEWQRQSIALGKV